MTVTITLICFAMIIISSMNFFMCIGIYKLGTFVEVYIVVLM